MPLITRLLHACLALSLILPWPLVPDPVAGAGLEVEGTVRLEYREEPYAFAFVRVEYLATLIIEPGVTLAIKGGGIDVYGKLVAHGNRDRPITFTGADRWQSLRVWEGAYHAELAFLTFENFEGPIQFYNRQGSLDELKFVDGRYNDLLIGRPGIEVGDMDLTNLSFVNRRMGTAMQQSRITFTTKMGEVFLNHVSFDSGGAFSSLPWNRYGISAPLGWRGFQLFDVRFPYGCLGNFERFVYGAEASFEPDPDCVAPTLPTVFVPGYGTSLNLQVLSQRPGHAGPSQGGWRFFNLLSPAYQELAADYRSSGLPFVPAYYDWRLPAAKSASDYLKPVIDEVKRTYNVPAVNLVAHSFGGIVSRSYIQGGAYGGDVASLVMLGTPNDGAAKAYGAWEGGVLPDDWSPLYHLLRFYRYKYGNSGDTDGSVVREFFPSGRELMPAYPALIRGGEKVHPRSLTYANETVLGLDDRHLASLVRTVTYGSGSETTLDELHVGPAHPGQTDWPDGRILDAVPAPASGDGTVALESVSVEGAKNWIVSGTHADLPATASRSLIAELYGQVRYVPRAGSLFGSGWRAPSTSFLFDCPIDVSIRLPDGSIRNSTDPDGLDAVGEVERSDDVLWMLMPSQLGTYEVTVKARESTPVRMWQDRGAIIEFSLQKDEERTFRLVRSVTDNPDPSEVPVPAGSLDRNEEKSSLPIDLDVPELAVPSLAHGFPAVAAIPTPSPLISLPVPPSDAAPPVEGAPDNRSKAAWIGIVGGLIIASGIGTLFRRRK